MTLGGAGGAGGDGIKLCDVALSVLSASLGRQKYSLTLSQHAPCHDHVIPLSSTSFGAYTLLVRVTKHTGCTNVGDARSFGDEVYSVFGGCGSACAHA